jgi:drug/metabolite transporter (DMT)-like permease
MTDTATKNASAEAPAPAAPAPKARPLGGDLASVAVCSLIWGTTWFAITRQYGVVPALVSVTYRFAGAAAILFLWLLITRRSLKLTRRQHLTVLLAGFFNFTINYSAVYFAEERIASAAAAVGFAGLAFVNLVLFRIAEGQKASRSAWAAAALGVLGVAVMSWAELARAHMDARAWAGMGFVFMGVIAAAFGNLFAHKAHDQGVELTAATAWSMAYGAVLLALWALVTGANWTFDPKPAYAISLFYLTVFGSVIAFLTYFGLARRRGFTFASYISAITPPIAMGISAVFEHARWGMEAFVGVGLVVLGQILLIRSRKA